MKLLALILSLTIAENVVALDSLVYLETRTISRLRMTPIYHKYYVYNNINVKCDYEYPRAYKIVDGQEIELEYPLDYLKRLEQLYQLQEPQRKQKQKEAENRAREEENQKIQKEKERRKQFEENKPQELMQIEQAIKKYGQKPVRT